MVTVQLINHGGCHQGSHAWESLNIHQILDASKVNVNQCCKNRKGCILQADFGTSLYPFEECFSTCGWMMRSDNVRSSHLSVAAEEHTDYRLCAWWLKCTVLHSGVTQMEVVPSASLGTMDPDCIYSSFLCGDRSPWAFTLIFSL